MRFCIWDLETYFCFWKKILFDLIFLCLSRLHPLKLTYQSFNFPKSKIGYNFVIDVTMRFQECLKLSIFSIPPWEWYLGEIKTCQFWFSHSNPLPMGSSWAKKIFVKLLYGWDMAPCSYFRLSSYTISWTHIRCFWGTNRIFDFFQFSSINRDLSKNPCY